MLGRERSKSGNVFTIRWLTISFFGFRGIAGIIVCDDHNATKEQS